MERLDDLQFQDLKIFQNTDYPAFTQDSVLLVHFMRLRSNDSVVDLGSGTGILSVLGNGYYGCPFTGVEISSALCALANRSAKLNGQPLNFVEADVGDAPHLLGWGAFTAVVCNPPYFNGDVISKNVLRSTTRHAEAAALDRFFESAFQLLKNRGKFFLCFPTERLSDVFQLLQTHRLEPKRLQLVESSSTGRPYLALIEARKLASPGLIFEKNIVAEK